jgi:hypothetical protein
VPFTAPEEDDLERALEPVCRAIAEAARKAVGAQ